ncbi:MAG: flavin reductase family protein [bacterium]
MILDLTELKNSFARYATGVTVVSCLDKDNGAVGITVNSYTSVSLTPPMVLWCIDRQASIYPQFAEASHYAISILSHEDEALATRFATYDQHQMQPEEAEIMKSGVPVLKQRLAGLDCEIVNKIPAGDHDILLGRVIAADYRDGIPLIYCGRTYTQGLKIID